VPISSLNQIALQTLAYARSIARDADDSITAVHISDDPAEAEALRAEWEKRHSGVPLTIVESPYRSLVGPLLAYVDALHARHPEKTLTVILPEMVPAHWWEQILHNQTALRLKAALLFRPGIVVASVPYHLHRERPDGDVHAPRRGQRTEAPAPVQPVKPHGPRPVRVIRRS
jgi:hypothetical protein